MITKTFANAAIAVLIVSASAAACGSISNVGQNSTQAAQAGQICGQSSASKPGYPRPINKLEILHSNAMAGAPI